jgi:hypothetical protein
VLQYCYSRTEKGDFNMTTKTKKNVEALEKSLNSSNVVETLDQLEALLMLRMVQGIGE